MGLDLDKIVFFKNNEGANNEKIVLFGAGIVCQKFVKNFDKKQILYIVDNNKNLWGTKFEGINVESPKKLKKLKKNSKVVIMTTSFTDVISQIKNINKLLTLRVSSYLKNLIKIEYLQNLKKTFLVSSGLPETDKKDIGGGLYEVNLNGSNFKLRKVYSGIVHGVVKIKNGFAISDSVNGVILLDKNYKVKKKGSYPLKTRAHGIAFDEQGKNYYVACSNTDQIKVFNNNLKFLYNIPISDKFKKYKSPQHHINDICIMDQSLYVSMFSLSGNHKRNIYDGGVYEIDLKTKKIINNIYGNLLMPHSIKYLDNSFVILDSLKGNLIIGSKSVATFSGFSRGLSFDGTYYYIGQSRNRNFSLINENKNDISIDNSILIYDLDNKISRRLNLPITEIHEVLTI